MKKTNVLIFVFLIMASYSLSAQVAITTDGSSAAASAMLDVQSTSKGFLPPRMTEVQMNAIASPAFGLIVMCTDCTPKGPYYFDGDAFVNFGNNDPSGMSSTDVYNPATGKIWMDRNLGATQVATSSADAASYGYLYQWGRFTDGHQIRTSTTTGTLSDTDAPGHGNFILAPNSPYDWRSGQNNNLWQGVSGTNNPCPAGYRLPTEAEWEAERASWSSNNAAGAFASPLKLPEAGSRNNSGSLNNVGGYYWSSTINDVYSYGLYFTSDAFMNSGMRAYGFSVRCIKD